MVEKKKKIWGQCMRETKGKEPSYGQETSRTTISTAKEERYVHGERDQVIHRRGGEKGVNRRRV